MDKATNTFNKGGEPTPNLQDFLVEKKVILPNANKMFHLPLEICIYVPSTKDVDKIISSSELQTRVDEVSKFLANKFGGFTLSEKIGGFMSSKNKLVNL